MEQDLIVTIVVAVIGSQALGKIVDAIIQWIRDKERKPTALEDGVKWLLQERLEHIMERDILAGSTKRQTKIAVHRGYEAYHALKGNGDMTAMLHDYDELEVVY